MEVRLLTFDIARSVLLNHGICITRVEEFLDRYRKQPSVWRHFERLALEAATEGRRVGQNCIRELVRWECSKEKLDDGKQRTYQVNNNDTPLHTILFAWKYPEHADFFEQRECKRRAA